MSQDDARYLPLPYYPFDERPFALPLDPDECSTALHLAHGHLPRAASLLKVSPYRLSAAIRHSARLTDLRDDLYAQYSDRAAAEVIDAFNSPDDRRREWAASKTLAARLSQGHPFAPAPPPNPSLLSSSPAGSGRVIISWETDPLPPAIDVTPDPPIAPDTSPISFDDDD